MRWVLMEVLMRAWILAAVAALAVGQADAATYLYKFLIDKGQSGSVGIFVLDVPSMSNLSISRKVGAGYGTAFGGPVLYTTFSDEITGDYLPNFPDVVGEFDLETDSIGNVLSLVFSLALRPELRMSWTNTTSVVDFPYDQRIGTGHWTFREIPEWPRVSPVPTPASAPLLLGALGLLGVRRFRASARA